MAAEAAKAAVEAKIRAEEEAAALLAAERAAEAQPKVSGGGGCFLTLFDTNQGTLRMVWSETDVDGCLAKLTPKKPVPKFKYKHNMGRSDIMKQANLGVGKANFLDGFTQFIKAGRAFDSSVTLYCDAIRVVFLNKDNGLEWVPNTSQPFPFSHFQAVSVQDKDFEGLKGIQYMKLDQFSATAQMTGGFTKLLN